MLPAPGWSLAVARSKRASKAFPPIRILRLRLHSREWSRNLKIRIGGKALEARFERATARLQPGAGNMPVLRVQANLTAEGRPGTLVYQDGNYPDRAGWKEIVIAAASGAVLD